MKNITPLIALALLSSCAQLQTDAQKLQAFNTSPTGKALLGTVQLAASAFAPQYAGVIGLGIGALETGSIPTSAAAVSTLAAVTGSKTTDAKVLTLASAVLDVAAKASTPTVGLQAAANAVSPPVTPLQAQQANP